MDSGKQPNLTGLCSECGKPTKLVVKSRGEYLHTCSVSCGTKRGQRLMLKKTGGKHPSQTPEVKARRAATNMERYGSATALQQPWVLEKRAVTMAKPEVVQKIQGTLLKNHGVTSPLKSPKIKQKQLDTTLERYGVLNAMQNEEIKQQNIESNRQRYVNDELKKKLAALKQLLDIVPLFDITTYSRTGVEYQWRHLTCGLDFAYTLHVNGAFPRCPKCHSARVSIPQQLVKEMIESMGEQVKNNDRTVLRPRELDLFIEEKNLAIEINGVYWHQADTGRMELLRKTKLCAAKGIQLLHFWDVEVLLKTNIVKDIIAARLGHLCRRVYARNCRLEKIEKHVAMDFLLTNHLEDVITAELYLALFYEDELILVASFGQFRGKIRLFQCATKLDVSCVGGISRLIKHAKNEYKVPHIITYVNRRYSNGSSYAKLSSIEPTINPRNYFYAVGFGDNMQIIPIVNKRKLEDLKNFDKQLSEAENVRKNNWLKISDCGTLKFIL